MAGLAPAKPVPLHLHNDTLVRAYKRVDELEVKLANILEPLLVEFGNEAARAFEARATDHLTAAALVAAADIGPRSAMVALYPRPDEAVGLAEKGGERPEVMHVTLAYLGDLPPEKEEEAAAALRRVAGAHAPLEGHTGGVGAFQDNGNGVPAILLPDVPGLVEVRQAVCEALVDAGLDYSRLHGFVPHMTVAYRPGDVSGSNHAEVDSGGAGRASALGSDAAGGMPHHGADSLSGSPDGEGRREVLQDVPDRLGAPDRANTGGSRTPSPLSERPVSERGPHGAGHGQGAWEDPRPEAGAVLGARDAVRLSRQSGLGEVSGLQSGSDSALSREAPGLTPDHSKLGAPLHFDSLHLVVGDKTLAQVPLTGAPALTAAAGLPDWTPPAPDEIINVEEVVSRLRTKLDPVRLAVVESVQKPVLDAAGIAFDATNPLTAKVLAQSGSQVVGIADTTRLNVMRAIRHAYDEGLSIPDTSKAIRVGMAAASPARARLIARTELVGAAAGGSLAAAQTVAEASGDAMFKQWLTADGAAYPRHEDYDGLDGQTVRLDDLFEVGADQLEYPGDPAGSPEEVCNCRCTLAYTENASDLTGEAGGIDGEATEEI